MIADNWGTAVGYLAVRCIASKGPDYVTAEDVAHQGKLSVAFTHKILRELCRRGILTSARGRGYKLERPPAQVTLLDLFKALEGPGLFPSCCPLHAPECLDRQRCPLWSACSRAQETLSAELAAITLDRLPNDEAGLPACLRWRNGT